MSIPEDELESLKGDGLEYSIVPEGGMTCLVVRKFALPGGYNRTESDLLLRLPAGFPDTPPDMWWFSPPVRRKDGKGIQATEVVEHYMGKSWQRWSRHFADPSAWKAGRSGVESYLSIIRKDFEKWVFER